VLEVDDPAVQREKLMAQMKNEPSPLRVLAQDAISSILCARRKPQVRPVLLLIPTGLRIFHPNHASK
jgi:hypothetical protein